MDFHQALLLIQHSISFAGVLVIFSGVLLALYRYLKYLVIGPSVNPEYSINGIRLTLGRVLVLGLEFIVGADLIGTTTAPDYYSIGIVACIVAIRTVLSYTLNREIASLSEGTAPLPK
ncbi:MAG: DUF1622 domain-containing protein [Pseudomonadota bacterium]